MTTQFGSDADTYPVNPGGGSAPDAGSHTAVQPGSPQSGSSSSGQTDADKYGGGIGQGGSVIVQH